MTFTDEKVTHHFSIDDTFIHGLDFAGEWTSFTRSTRRGGYHVITRRGGQIFNNYLQVLELDKISHISRKNYVPWTILRGVDFEKHFLPASGPRVTILPGSNIYIPWILDRKH